MMNEETKASLNKFFKEREERIKNMTLAEARDIISSTYGHSDMRMESDKALQMLLDCADKTLDQQPSFINKPCVSEGVCREDKIQVLDKIRAEIERKAHSGQWSDATMYGMLKAVAIIDKYRAESGDKE